MELQKKSKFQYFDSSRIMSAFPLITYPTSVRDCSGNPASHHILLLLYKNYKYFQGCDADWSEHLIGKQHTD
jgi:hypothetical protein